MQLFSADPDRRLCVGRPLARLFPCSMKRYRAGPAG
jgi:hypothetical protein